MFSDLDSFAIVYYTLVITLKKLIFHTYIYKYDVYEYCSVYVE